MGKEKDNVTDKQDMRIQRGRVRARNRDREREREKEREGMKKREK